jgi:elongation factor Ts
MPVVPSPHQVTQTKTSPSSPSHLPAPETVRSSLASIVSRLGENIKLHRASSIALEPSLPSSPSPTFLASSYLHASKTPTDVASKDGVQSGTLGGLLIAKLSKGGNVEKPEVKSLLRALARQVVAIPTSSVVASPNSPPLQEGEPSTALYDQQLITMAPSPKFEFEHGSNVQEVLKKWSQVRGVEGEGLQVVELARWELGAAEEAKE